MCILTSFKQDPNVEVSVILEVSEIMFFSKYSPVAHKKIGLDVTK